MAHCDNIHSQKEGEDNLNIRCGNGDWTELRGRGQIE